ncbi:MAG TPA: FAD-dependent oxidoreductase [Candidatus Pygmaiobacter gallistercoris]|nr:FAD-dependent oxidoreductase [Candidatus Pygmaiobacter gallistercoris]
MEVKNKGFDYDLGVIGAGPAGLSAAIYAARGGLSVVCFEREVHGGQIINSPEVENYPALGKVSGADFANALYEQATGFGAEVVYEEILSAELTGEVKLLRTAAREYRVRAVVLAGGVTRRKLGCPGEERLLGRGVSYCATCDGAFFAGRTVAVVGGGNTAVEDALYLAARCEKVYLIHRRQGFRASEAELAKLRANPRVEFLLDAQVAEIRGENQVESILLRSTAGAPDRVIPVAAVFVAVGLIPNNEMFRGQLPLTAQGYLTADENCRTALPRVYAAGDTREKALRQLVTAAADGALAGSSAVADLAGEATL